jgi:hypothetical protein
MRPAVPPSHFGRAKHDHDATNGHNPHKAQQTQQRQAGEGDRDDKQ